MNNMTEEEIERLLDSLGNRNRLARAHIQNSFDANNTGLQRWCERKKKFSNAGRLAVAAILATLIGAGAAHAITGPAYYHIEGDGNHEYALHTADNMLHRG